MPDQPQQPAATPVDAVQKTPVDPVDPVAKVGRVHVDEQQIVDIVRNAVSLELGWKHLSPQMRATLVGAVASGVVGLVLGLVHP